MYPMKDEVLGIIERFCKNFDGNPPCEFMGLTGSTTLRERGRFSDYDLLVFADCDPEKFWRCLPVFSSFIAQLARDIRKKLECNVTVASSLAAQDLMPFVATDLNSTENVLLHVLLYPTPDHFVRWEPPEVRSGLLRPFRNNKNFELIGTLESFQKFIDPDFGLDYPIQDQGDVFTAADTCIQAFVAGVVQASCYDLYRSDFVSRYSFHLLRYAARYLISYDDRFNESEEEPANLPVSLPITAQTPHEARVLLQTWLRAWKERNEEPLADQLISLYKSAIYYFEDLYKYLRNKHATFSQERTVVDRELPWTVQETKELERLGRAASRPVFVVFGDRISSNLDAATQLLETTLATKVNNWFSVKSFPSKNLITELAAHNTPLNFAIATQRELDLLVEAKVAPNDILLHAPALDSELETSLSQGKVAIISVGSQAQYQKLESIIPSDFSPNLLARITVPGHHNSKFGMSLGELKSILHSKHGLLFSGIHVHLGGSLYCKESVLAAAEVVAKALELACVEVDRPLINLGGGWRSQTYEDWFELQGIDNIRILTERICELTKQDIEHFKICFEFGHRIVEDAAVVLCHVLETRKTEQGYMHILDGGTGILPTLKSAVYGASSMPVAGDLVRVRGKLVGPACYEADRFGDVELDLTPGDLVIFSNVGAYSLAFASGFGGFFPDIKAIFKRTVSSSNGQFDFSDWSLW